MKNVFKLVVASIFAWTGTTAVAEDIDLFASGLTEGAAADSVPNVIFLIDNSANWTRANQAWPDYPTQGEAEIAAIKNTMAALPADVDLNVALFEYATSGSSGTRDGGYVRFDLQSYQDNKAAFEAELDTIFENINSNDERRDQSNPFGYLISDVYNYLAGIDVNFAGASTPAGLVDDDGYSQTYTQFESPLSEGDVCSETYVIFITNPASSGPRRDAVGNSAQLEALYAALGESPDVALSTDTNNQTGGHIMPAYGETGSGSGSGTGGQTLIGQTEGCYESLDECSSDVLGNTDETQAIQDDCPAGQGNNKNPNGCVCTGSGTTSNASGDACPVVTVKIRGTDTDIPTKSYEVFGTIDGGGGDDGDGSSGWGVVDGSEDSASYNLDDWAQFMHEYGVPLTIPGEGDDEDFTVRVPVTTYTIDVFNARPSDIHSSLMDITAELGGGYRQSATNSAELETALNRIFGDIIDVNTSFAAVTLPLSATNRAQSENKVFVGMFRPGAQRKPRWLGNLKQYQLAVFNGQIELADVDYNRAINPQTGFAQSCATSFWTTDTTDVDSALAGDQPYFEGLGLDPNPVSECQAAFLDGRSVLSDSPDGPFVEKGGAAQQIRNQVDDSDQSTRLLLTEASGSLRTLAAGDFGDAAYYNYLVGTNPGLKGGDLLINDGTGIYVSNPALSDPEAMPDSGLRATIHGDIIHSRPLTVSYGTKADGTTDFRIFYGSNDGLYRAVDPDDGSEDWALIAPEHYSWIERLYRNTPSVEYFGTDASLSTSIGALRKQYFFDGSAGSYTVYNADRKLTTAYIYPTMRRGGRMIYGLDVSPGADGAPAVAGVAPDQPDLLWKLGCPNLDNDTGCVNEGGVSASDLDGIGQTWSTPSVGLVEGYSSGNSPVLFMGGGFDDCLDDDSAGFPNDCTKGKQVFAIDATTGALIATFDTDEPVVAEVTPLDIDSDGFIDFVYAADAAGNLYRVSLSSISAVDDPAPAPLTSGNWFIDKIANASSSNVRFMNKPIIGELGNYVFVTLGTGDRERPLKVNYPYASDVTNRFYVFIDRPFPYDEDGTGVLEADEVEISPRPSVNLDGSTMVNASVGLADGEALIDKDGWYLELQDRGEQVVNQSAIGGGSVFFNTFQPEGGSQGLCANLGTSKAYQIPLFAPEDDDGEEFGQGVPIPPIIVTVDLDSVNPSCEGDGCGDGELPDEVVTVCIGCEGFNPLEIVPTTDDELREAFRAENMDVQ